MKRQTKQDIIMDKFLLWQRKYPDKNTFQLMSLMEFYLGIPYKKLEKIILAKRKKSAKVR